LIVRRRTLLYIRTFEGVKVNPSPKVFWKTPSLIPTFEGRFVNPDRKFLFTRRCLPIYPDI
jgi:hypothetical protein